MSTPLLNQYVQWVLARHAESDPNNIDVRVEVSSLVVLRLLQFPLLLLQSLLVSSSPPSLLSLLQALFVELELSAVHSCF